MSDLGRTFFDQLTAEVRALPRRLDRRQRTDARLAGALSIDDLRALARRSVPGVVFDFVDGGANDEVSLRSNREDLERLRLLPRVLVGVDSLDPGTTVLGQSIAHPILGAPTGLTGLVHHDGELAVARAVQDAGSIYILSAMASYSIEEVAAGTTKPFWFQVYAWRDREFVGSLIDRAAAAGCPALVVTVDVPLAGSRERDLRNGFGIPPRLTWRSALQGASRPRWTYDFFRRPRIAVANAAGAAQAGDTVSLLEYLDRQFDRSLSWDDLAWIRDRWRGPLVLKGLLHPADVRMAIEIGAQAVIVSNHGGRQLDDASSSIAALAGAVEAAADRCEVYVDGGIRRGTDVLKALALGAKACLVGRPLVYGLAAGGERGVCRALEMLDGELERAMALAGLPEVSKVDRGLIAPGGTAAL